MWGIILFLMVFGIAVRAFLLGIVCVDMAKERLSKSEEHESAEQPAKLDVAAAAQSPPPVSSIAADAQAEEVDASESLDAAMNESVARRAPRSLTRSLAPWPWLPRSLAPSSPL